MPRLLTPGSRLRQLGVTRGRSLSAAFNPLRLSPALWLDTSDPTTLYQDSALTTAVASNGDPFGGWKGYLGTAANALQATSARRGTFQHDFAGLPVVQFDRASTQWIESTGLADLRGGCVYIFCRVYATTTENFASYWGLGGAGSGNILCHVGSPVNGIGLTQPAQNIANGVGYNASNVLCIRYQRGSGAAFEVKVFGTGAATDPTLTGNLVNTTGTSDRMAIGASYNNSNVVGDANRIQVYAVLARATPLTAPEETNLLNFYAPRIGLVVSPNIRRYLFSSFDSTAETFALFDSTDGTRFRRLSGISYVPGVGTVRDPHLYRDNATGTIWLAYTSCGVSGPGTSFGVAKSTDGGRSWTKVTDADCSGVITNSASSLVWAPKWFLNPSDGNWYVIVNIRPDGTDANFRPYYLRPTNAGRTTWTTPTLVGGFSSAFIDTFLVSRADGFYYALAKAFPNGNITAFRSSSPLSGYSTYSVPGISGFAPNYEGPTVSVLAERWYLDKLSPAGVAYSDPSGTDWSTASFSGPTALTVAPPAIRHGGLLDTSV